MCCCSPTTIDTNRREGKMLTGIALVNAIHLWKPHLIRCNSWGYAHIFNHIQLIYKSIFVNRWHHSYQFGFFFVYFTSSDFSVYFICLLHPYSIHVSQFVCILVIGRLLLVFFHSWCITFFTYHIQLMWQSNNQPTNQKKQFPMCPMSIDLYYLSLSHSFVQHSGNLNVVCWTILTE